MMAAWLLMLLWQAVPFQIVTTHLPVPQAGRVYQARLEAEGGVAPYRWEARSPLPAGLRLDATTGELAGRLFDDRPFSIVVEATDSSPTPLHQTTGEGAPLELAWAAAPAIAADHVAGAVAVANGSREAVRVTLIAVAVDAGGKAFALRYDQRTLRPGERTPPLAFDVLLPGGRYRVRVDAAGEDAARGHIFRGHLTAPGLVVP